MTARHHGVAKGRGCAHLAQSHFGRLFPDLPPLFSSNDLLEVLGKPGGLMESDATANSDIPAGYTFFAQFVDHDVTLDTTSRLDSDWVQDPATLPNLRSASLDLDCVYGNGPEASPHLYDGDSPGRLLLGTDANPDDLARAKDGTALIGDPRNDENLFVNQVQATFIKLHNRFIDDGMDFEAAQAACRYNYQYVVLHDFLRRVCDPGIYAFALDRIYRHDFPLCFGPDAHGKLAMPVEFSVAAYRFGHSMVRSQYPIRKGNKHQTIELFSETQGTTGFTPVPAAISLPWDKYFDLGNASVVASKAIDASLARELNNLPFLAAGEPNPLRRSLAFRNLLRGRSLGLPSGQDVAAALAACGYPITPECPLTVPRGRGKGGLPQELRKELTEHTPLFYYVLAEGGDNNHLGPTGSAVLMEVFGAMLLSCGTSYFHAEHWDPGALAGPDHGLELGDLVAYAHGL